MVIGIWKTSCTVGLLEEQFKEKTIKVRVAELEEWRFVLTAEIREADVVAAEKQVHVSTMRGIFEVKRIKEKLEYLRKDFWKNRKGSNHRE